MDGTVSVMWQVAMSDLQRIYLGLTDRSFMFFSLLKVMKGFFEKNLNWFFEAKTDMRF